MLQEAGTYARLKGGVCFYKAQNPSSPDPGSPPPKKLGKEGKTPRPQWCRASSRRCCNVKVPSKINTYCPKCNSHTEHSVSLYKKGKERALAIGARRHERELHGYGGQKYPIQRRKAKVTDKKTLVLKCSRCGRIVMREGIRLKKLELMR